MTSEGRPIQPLDVRRRREILVYAEISRFASQNRIYLTPAQIGAMATEVVSRLYQGREFA